MFQASGSARTRAACLGAQHTESKPPPSVTAMFYFVSVFQKYKIEIYLSDVGSDTFPSLSSLISPDDTEIHQVISPDII